jgi:hypothetical protein
MEQAICFVQRPSLKLKDDVIKNYYFAYSFTFIVIFSLVIPKAQSMAANDNAPQVDSEKRAINHSIDNFMDLINAFDNLTKIVTNVYTMEENGLSSSKLNQAFWSYHSLPLYKGGTANRFNHNEFNNLNSWEHRHNSYQENPAEAFLRSGATHMLSPLEKYELIIDTDNFSLTAREWFKGREYVDRIGAIPNWVGACHGTAPSSLSHPRPKSAISILSADGRNSILFYPSDIKALLAFAWTTNGGPSAVMGSRCNSYDGNSAQSCLDTNPGSFHLALANLIGIHKMPLIIDTDSGAQVWNRPVVGYSFSYFNPQFRNYTRTISNAIIDLARYHNDPYRSFRAEGTKKIVGVRSEIELIDETLPTTDLTDNISNDKYFKLIFSYDLELDHSGEIIGGMWHQSHFPDFVWVVSPNSLPLSNSERWLPRLTTVNSSLSRLPLVLREVGKDSQKDNQVSYWVIDYLLRLSAEN